MEERVHYAIIRTVDATEGRLGVGGRSCCSLLQCCLDRGRGGVAALCSRSGEGDGYAVCVCSAKGFCETLRLKRVTFFTL